jgi:translation initiation factor IF-1
MKSRPLAQTTVSGTIDGFRKMNLQQTPESEPIEQTLARVNLENGNTWIVALGDKKVMRKMKPESGDNIEVSGVRAMIDGKPAIIASSITIDGETMNIKREAAENIAFTGTIDDYGKARLSGKKKPQHLVVSLMLEDGSDRGIVVDFGPKTNMKDLKLESGKQITVVGRKAQIGEKSVLVAQKFEIIE